MAYPCMQRAPGSLGDPFYHSKSFLALPFIATMSFPPKKIMKICCFPYQDASPEASQENKPDAQDGGDSPTSHMNAANPMAKENAAELCDAAFVIEGKELKAHTQVKLAMADMLPNPEHISVPQEESEHRFARCLNNLTV